MSNETKSDKYANIKIAGVWPFGQNGHLQSALVDDAAYDALTRHFEKGGKFLIRQRSMESIQKSKDPAKSPSYYLEFVPKAEVDAFKAKQAAKKANQIL